MLGEAEAARGMGCKTGMRLRNAPFPYLPKQKRADLKGPARSMHSL